ncbi:hypothetical protein DACRYDRAFT_52460 [Dacryopinax primogenitus]|uniref:CxC2-like cysteine cluster KDZ transposase-associated domain-containing protein n=1 Tax=Dacryopinax primogenitus (strain DJM 731) TaxID=1858805 RepID=M5GCI9_DACPD|nr:uncharacterized protein DACRYDRAFT_52460 [Dacryopinax primogenitus]EJU01798.1 hypothetical protein DACRYDRAFT_52460 [Dacryopinax primogenitus]
MLFQGNVSYCSSGVYSWSCLHHSLYRPGGMVDCRLGKGVFSNIDYAFAGAIAGAKALPVIYLSYDLACMWSLKWKERMKSCFPHLVQLWDHITFVMPKMHKYTHHKQCCYRFSLSFKQGAAGVDGEGVGRTWAEHNQLGGSTKEMNPGHCLDCLEAHFVNWNWKKQQDMSE